jgi:hypothetical protein
LRFTGGRRPRVRYRRVSESELLELVRAAFQSESGPPR